MTNEQKQQLREGVNKIADSMYEAMVQSYEMVENITNTNVKYLMFRIVLYADHCGVNNVGQIALGFNMSRRVN